MEFTFDDTMPELTLEPELETVEVAKVEPEAPKPKVDLPWSPGDLMEKGKGRWPEGLGEVASVGLQWLSLPLQKSWQGA